MGVVASAFGTLGVVRGLDGVPGGGGRRGRPDADPWLASADSEFRFFSAWYAAAGIDMLDAAVGTRAGRGEPRWLGPAWLAAATGRALAIRSRGRPHPFYLVLMGLELVLGVERLATRLRRRCVC